MDHDEFVETSDPEEIEESQATKWAYWQIVISDQNIYRRDDYHSPRKRVKVSRRLCIWLVLRLVIQKIRLPWMLRTILNRQARLNLAATLTTSILPPPKIHHLTSHLPH